MEKLRPQKWYYFCKITNSIHLENRIAKKIIFFDFFYIKLPGVNNRLVKRKTAYSGSVSGKEVKKQNRFELKNPIFNIYSCFQHQKISFFILFFSLLIYLSLARADTRWA